MSGSTSSPRSRRRDILNRVFRRRTHVEPSIAASRNPTASDPPAISNGEESNLAASDSPPTFNNEHRVAVSARSLLTQLSPGQGDPALRLVAPSPSTFTVPPQTDLGQPQNAAAVSVEGSSRYTNPFVDPTSQMTEVEIPIEAETLHVSTTKDWWEEALAKLNGQEIEIVQKHRTPTMFPEDPRQRLHDLLYLVQQKKDICEQRRWTFTLTGHTFTLSKEADRIIRWIDRFKQVGDIAVNADPLHAGLPWALIRTILQATISDRDQMCGLILGLERIAYILDRCNVIATFCSQTLVSKTDLVRSNLQCALIDLYVLVLRFLSKALAILDGSSIYRVTRAFWKLEDITSFSTDCQNIETRVEGAVQDFERRLTELRHEIIARHADRRDRETSNNMRYIMEHLGNTRVQGERISNQLTSIIQLLRGDSDMTRIVRGLEQSAQRSHSDLTASIGMVIAELKTLQLPMESLNSLVTHLGRVWSTLENEKRGRILYWVSPIPYEDHHTTAVMGRTENTGDWIFHRQEWVEWHDSNTSMMLWLHGISGAGKTKLVTRVVESLNKSQSTFTGIAYFYCSRLDEKRQKAVTILRSFIKQLAVTPANQIHFSLYRLYEEKQKSGFASESLSWAESTTLLLDLFGTYPRVVLVLDALDECDANERSELLTFFAAAVELFPCLKIFISSRRDEDITRQLCKTANLGIEASDNELDIQKFVQDVLAKDSRQRSIRGISAISKDLAEDISHVLLEKSRGMFQWASIQVQYILSLQREKDIRQRLGALPKDLSKAYEEIIGRIMDQEGSRPEIAMTVFQWVYGSVQPVPMKALVAAVLQNQNDDELEDVDIDTDYVLGCCLNLITIDQAGNCRFSHLSVQEYFSTQRQWSLNTCQELIMNVCLKTMIYCRVCESSESQYLQQLKEFALDHWDVLPGGKTRLPITSARTVDLLQQFLGSPYHPSLTFQNWIEPCFGSLNFRAVFKPCYPVFIVTFVGIQSILEKWLKESAVHANLESDGGMSLLCFAISGRRQSAVNTLLEYGADIDASGMPLYSAMKLAWKDSDLTYLSDLIARGAKVNNRLAQGDTLLERALDNGNLNVIKTLLLASATLRPQYIDDAYGQRKLLESLNLAVDTSEVEIVEKLLQQGANPNGPAVTLCGNPLRSALYQESADREEMLGLLRAYGAEIDPPYAPGYILTTSCFRGSLAIVQQLLDIGENPNVICNTVTEGALTPLIAAVAHRQRDIALLLLERGANVNTRIGHLSGEYDTALSAAGSQDMKRLLISYNAIDYSVV